MSRDQYISKHHLGISELAFFLEDGNTMHVFLNIVSLHRDKLELYIVSNELAN